MLKYKPDLDQAKTYWRAFWQEGVLYVVDAPSQQEADDLLAWLHRNT